MLNLRAINKGKDMNRFPTRRAIFAGLVALGLSATALSAQPLNNGLGQAWPNTVDASASLHWHVYLFANDGLRYVQINDLNGNVRAAFATANGQFLVLPMGRDAQRLSTPQQSAAPASTGTTAASGPETVYRDDSIQITATLLSDGTTAFSAAPTTTRLIAPCDNPEDCNTHLN